jgi:hypothetical protein
MDKDGNVCIPGKIPGISNLLGHKRCLNTYFVLRSKGDVCNESIIFSEITFHISNIKKIYLVKSQKEKDYIKIHSTLEKNLVGNLNKTVAIEFKKPLVKNKKSDEFKHIKLKRCYVSLKDPDSFIKDINNYP